jgi:protein-L-isoaspartate(D-aspartate) O-methyltransferase
MKDNYSFLRQRMVHEQLVERGIKSPQVLEAFRNVPRQDFVPLDLKASAYVDRPLSIGCEQTISQPFMAALMTENLLPVKDKRVLEIGTGSGYQTAILSYLGAKVYTVERYADLSREAEIRLKQNNLPAVFRVSDGSLGWEEESPFSRIIITAACLSIPPPLLSQLSRGGKLVAPVGGPASQSLVKITKVGKDEFYKEDICGCIFVPLVGKYGLAPERDL